MLQPTSRDYSFEMVALLQEMAAEDRSVHTTRNELGKLLGLSPNVVVGLLRSLEARREVTVLAHGDGETWISLTPQEAP